MGKPRHLIAKQSFDIAFSGAEPDAQALQRRAAALCGEALREALAAVLDRLDPGHGHWTIGRIEIDAGRIALDRLDSDLALIVGTALEQGLRQQAASRPASAPRSSDAMVADADAEAAWRGPEQALCEAFVDYLATGLLPWWYRLPEGQPFTEAVAALWATGTGRRDILRLLAQDSIDRAMVQRLARQFPPAMLRGIAEALAPEAVTAGDAMIAAGSDPATPSLSFRAREALLLQAALLSRHASGEDADAIIAHHALQLAKGESAAVRAPLTLWLEALPPGQRAPRAPVSEPQRRAPVRQAPERQLDSGVGLHLDCAGLVLLHPFLPQLFAACGVAEDGALRDPARALGLLHYLATGETEAPEHRLLLAKLLCGLNLDEPAPAPVPLSAGDRDEADALLAAVLGHWQALGDTSPQGLRGAFLVRPGKLLRRSGERVLQVEPHAADILLDRLPWGIGTIQLPWMTGMLWVEWRW